VDNLGLISIRFAEKDKDAERYCKRILSNIRSKLQDKTQDWNVGLSKILTELCEYWGNGISEKMSNEEGNEKIKPYYYTKEKIEELINLSNHAKETFSNSKKTMIEEMMPHILEDEGEHEVLKTIQYITNRKTIIGIYDDFIKNILAVRVNQYLKQKEEEKKE